MSCYMSKKIHKQDYKASKQTMGMHFRWSQLEDSVASVVSQHPTVYPWPMMDGCILIDAVIVKDEGRNT